MSDLNDCKHNPFEDFKVIEEYMKKYPPVEPIGIKALLRKDGTIKFLGLWYYGE